MIDVITASAGSGKTWRLTDLLAQSTTPPDAIMATTFTVKAAQELMGRARTRYIQAGRTDDAQLLPASLIGTVHAIGGRLLSDFAYELGLSPTLDVIPENDADLFVQEALEAVLTEEPWLSNLEDAAEAFNIEPATWQHTIRQLIDTARNNRIDAATLEACGPASAAELLQFLNPAQGGDWDATFLTALDTMLATVPRPQNPNKTQNEIWHLLTDARDALLQQRLRWSQWPKILKHNAGIHWNPFMDPVRTAAEAYLHHPKLRLHIEHYVKGLFHFAAKGLQEYRTYKETYRLIDYGDQEERLLALLEDPTARPRLAERVQLLLVDEFQDTSPMQLAIFLRLAELAHRSYWVGDPKQAIYNFRGTDPRLMHACLQQLRSGEVLDRSYRSRPHLVDLVSIAFTSAFATQGLTMARLQPARAETPGLPPAFGLWALETTNKPQDWQAIARASSASWTAPRRPR
jgi:ATP-dependent exoDNAse (exonuclease V) beta subunit